jgi:hypothetical protein
LPVAASGTKNSVARLDEADGSAIAKPHQDDCNGQDAPDAGRLARKRLQVRFGEMTGAGQRALPRYGAQLGTKRLRVRFMSVKRDGTLPARLFNRGVRIDELSAHRDVLTGALDRAARTPEGILFLAYRPKLEQLLVALR